MLGKKTARSSRFIKMQKPLMYDVKCRNKVVLPAGTEGVYIKFRGSWLTYTNPETGKTEHMNVYMHKGKCYHGW